MKYICGLYIFILGCTQKSTKVNIDEDLGKRKCAAI